MRIQTRLRLIDWLALPLMVIALHAQQAATPQSALPTFDAVSIRPIEACHRTTTAMSTAWECIPQYPCVYTEDKVTCQLMMRQLLLEAFQRKPHEMEAPDWIGQEMFVVKAVLAEKTTKDVARLMLQHALVERFGIQSHVEKKVLPAYMMVAAPGGLHLTEALPPEKRKKLSLGSHSGAAWVRTSDSFAAGAISLEYFGQLLSTTVQLDGPVLNGTGLNGLYTFDLHWDESDDFGILQALKKQNGMVLKKQKLPVDVLVIDHMNHMPTPNP